MAIDPLITARFGSPPDGIDLGEVYMESASALVITVSWLAVLATVLRFGARYLQHAGLEADDYASILALVRCLSCTSYVECFSTYPHDLALNNIRSPVRCLRFLPVPWLRNVGTYLSTPLILDQGRETLGACSKARSFGGSGTWKLTSRSL